MSIKLKGSSDGSVSFDAPADTSPSGSDITLTLPTSAGSADQFLKNSGIAGELEYSSMVETSTGVGIGTSSPTRLLTVQSTGNANLCIKSANTGVSQCMFGDTDSDVAGNIAYRHSDNAMTFEVNSSERARFDSSGRFMLGRTTATHKLSLTGAANDKSAELQLTASSVASGYIGPNANGLNIGTDTAGIVFKTGVTGGGSVGGTGAERMRIQSDGTVGIGFSNPSCKLDVKVATSSATSAVFRIRSNWQATDQIQMSVVSNGNVANRNNSYGAISDAKLKENIVDANSQWEDIKNIRVRNYNFIVNEGVPVTTHIGVVAQELETVSPGLVSESPDLDDNGNELGTTTKSVSYSVLYMKAVKALQEAQTRIETLETQNTAQQAQIDDLLARVTALEAA